MNRCFASALIGWLGLALGIIAAQAGAAETKTETVKPWRVHQSDKTGTLTVSRNGRDLLTYRYGPAWDLPHIYPLNSPAGRNMLVEKAHPYPHHRALWFADTVQLAGHKTASFYNALYTGVKQADGSYTAPFKNHIRHVRFDRVVVPASGPVVIEATLRWEMDGDTPVLDEHRTMRIVPLDRGQYLLDLTFTLKASYGPVRFVSDSVHYAWPYVRMNRQFNGDSGGVITNDHGQTGQKQTHNAVARWVDYSKAFDDGAEGLTVFSHPSNGQPHRWLTREYGTFGPRRVDARSGKPFTIETGRSITQRVGIYVHRGDVKSAHIGRIYKAWIDGKLD